MDKNKEKNSLLKISISVALLLVAFSIGYYFLWFLPHKEQQSLSIQTTKILQEQLNKESAEANLNACLLDVKERTTKVLDTVKEEDRRLSNEAWKLLLDVIEKQKEQCYKQYPGN